VAVRTGVTKFSPVYNNVPPVAALYHLKVVPPFAAAESVVALPEQMVCPVADTVGFG